MGLEGVHILVTGASGGVGLAVAEAFLARGSKVTLHYHKNADQVKKLADRFPGRAQALSAAVDSELAVDTLVANASAPAPAGMGPIAVLVVCHGIWPVDDVGVKDMSFDRWRHTIGVNLDGTFLLIRTFLRQLDVTVKNGTLPSGHDPSIVMIGSTAGKFGEAWHADYATTKTAMMYGFLRSLKNEVIRVHPRARVNTIAPGWIRTPMADRAMQDPALLYQALASTPLKKVSEPRDVVQAILFLCDADVSGNITGVCLDLNGGMEGRVIHQPQDFGSSRL